MENNKKHLGYGEITYKGLLKISEYIERHKNKNSQFLDIGSGYGKSVRFIAEINYIKSFGIEIDAERNNIAKKTSYSNQNGWTNYIYGDILDRLLMIDDFDFILCNNLLFDDKTTQKIIDNCKKNTTIFLLKINGLDINNIHHEVMNINVSWSNKLMKMYKIII